MCAEQIAKTERERKRERERASSTLVARITSIYSRPRKGPAYAYVRVKSISKICLSRERNVLTRSESENSLRDRDTCSIRSHEILTTHRSPTAKRKQLRIDRWINIARWIIYIYKMQCANAFELHVRSNIIIFKCNVLQWITLVLFEMERSTRARDEKRSSDEIRLSTAALYVHASRSTQLLPSLLL